MTSFRSPAYLTRRATLPFTCSQHRNSRRTAVHHGHHGKLTQDAVRKPKRVSFQLRQFSVYICQLRHCILKSFFFNIVIEVPYRSARNSKLSSFLTWERSGGGQQCRDKLLHTRSSTLVHSFNTDVAALGCLEYFKIRMKLNTATNYHCDCTRISVSGTVGAS